VASGASASEVARLLGVDSSTVRRWEGGSRVPRDPELALRYYDLLWGSGE
jgi:DNA-binding transcriptional regulator YiaG